VATNTIRSEGKINIPMEEFNNWVISKLGLPQGTFVALAAPVLLTDRIDVSYATATDFQPGPPAPETPPA
jgi:hypothetical protein